MANLAQMLQQLRNERNHVAKDLDRLDKAIAALSRLVSTSSAPPQARKAKSTRRLSAAARKRISEAQKARWAKVRKQKES